MEAYVRGEGDRDYKTILQELASQELRALPVYHIEERGPDHQKEFTATVVIAGETLGSGIGRSKKEAEQQAAREAHARIARDSATGMAKGTEGNGHGAP
jgi:ribonuclease-3